MVRVGDWDLDKLETNWNYEVEKLKLKVRNLKFGSSKFEIPEFEVWISNFEVWILDWKIPKYGTI